MDDHTHAFEQGTCHAKIKIKKKAWPLDGDCCVETCGCKEDFCGLWAEGATGDSATYYGTLPV